MWTIPAVLTDSRLDLSPCKPHTPIPILKRGTPNYVEVPLRRKESLASLPVTDKTGFFNFEVNFRASEVCDLVRLHDYEATLGTVGSRVDWSRNLDGRHPYESGFRPVVIVCG